MFNSFTVSFRKPESKHRTIVLGVTSIVPNLNGLLLFTEDNKGYQIEAHEMLKFEEEEPHLRLKIEYSDDWNLEYYTNPENGYDVHDHRDSEAKATGTESITLHLQKEH